MVADPSAAPSGGRPFGDRPFGDITFGDRPFGEPLGEQDSIGGLLAALDELLSMHRVGRPLLVGTTSIEASAGKRLASEARARTCARRF